MILYECAKKVLKVDLSKVNLTHTAATGTVNIASLLPNEYKFLTNNNFILSADKITISWANDGGSNASVTINQTLEYNANTGILTVSGLTGRTHSDRWGTQMSLTGTIYVVV